MLEIIVRVIDLQAEWAAQHTSATQERGHLVRHDIPTAIRQLLPRLSTVLNIDERAIGVVGGDGSTSKAAFPWVRIFSKERSPDPRHGWYLALLFHSEGQRFYLCLSHGSMDWAASELKPKAAREIDPLTHWAADLLAPFIAAHPALTTRISLGSRGKLGRSYEASTPIAKPYDIASLPSEAGFEADILLFAHMLRLVYEQEDLERAPTSAAEAFQKLQKDFSASIDGIQPAADPGFGLTFAERRAVEKHAMKMAEAYLSGKGYACEITSAYAPYDIIASKPNDREELIVEVKGTTSPGSHIFMTANEVEAHRYGHPNNALCLVHDIQLKREAPGAPPVASDGVLVVKKRWDIGEYELRAITYQVKL